MSNIKTLELIGIQTNFKLIFEANRRNFHFSRQVSITFPLTFGCLRRLNSKVLGLKVLSQFVRKSHTNTHNLLRNQIKRILFVKEYNYWLSSVDPK